MDVGDHPTRLAGAVVAALLLLVGLGVRSDSAALSSPDPGRADGSWRAKGNPYVWTMGDSITAACNLDTPSGGGMGIGWRDLGHIAWPGATTHQVVERLQGIGTWPASTVTEESVERERAWFRDAGAWIVELGTNDARTRTPEQYRVDVRWLLDRSNGRPVVWVNSQDPDWKHPGSAVPATIDALNAVLSEEAASRPNLRVVDWNRFLLTHPQDVRSDGVHPADGYACRHLFELVRAAVPGVPDPAAGP
jgi:hypothetical protein